MLMMLVFKPGSPAGLQARQSKHGHLRAYEGRLMRMMLASRLGSQNVLGIRGAADADDAGLDAGQPNIMCTGGAADAHDAGVQVGLPTG